MSAVICSKFPLIRNSIFHFHANVVVMQIFPLRHFDRFAIIWKKGYQEFDTPVSSVTAKLKGTALVNFTSFKSPILEGMHIFDPADYVVPPQVCLMLYAQTLKISLAINHRKT